MGCAGAGGSDDAAASAPANATMEAPAGALSLGAIDLQKSLAPVSSYGPLIQAGASKAVSLVRSAVGQQAVVEAREAMQKQQWSKLADLVPIARGDELLGPYAEYWFLRQQLHDTNQPLPTAALQKFMAAHADAYLADRLKGDWIIAAARSADYDTAIRLGPVVNSNAHIECSRLLALHETGKRVSAAQAMAAFQPGRSCWALFDELVANRVVGWAELAPLLRATLETSKTGNAQRIADYMFMGPEKADYRALMKNPKAWLAKRKRPATKADTELVTLALSRLAYGNDRDANAAYIESKWASAIPRPDLEWVWSQFGLVAALNVETGAVRWYRRSGNQPLTDYNHAWQVRSELRQAPIDWTRVGAAIKRMSAAQQAEPVWTYWQGRALAALGNQKAAREHFASIERELSFYGQLASEELGHTPGIPPAPAPVTAAELAAAQSSVGLQRALRLFELGWRPEAVPEWNYALRGMSDRQLLAAAELARHESIFDRVVNTSLQTRNEIDFRQRFIAPFEGKVAEKARQINLDPAWVYGLIRQESRFITDARSRVGASGLMQLMPATARWVARKIGMKDFNPSSVNDFDTNTILGTNYLSMVLNNLSGSQVLATAGYNAGPKRPLRWRSQLAGPVEGAIFAETIPFTETRLYVKHVMSNATYYAMLFSGQPHSLKARLGVVSPQPTTGATLP